MSSKYLCLDCGEVYNSSGLNINELFDEIWCPKTNCCGTLIEVDELLIPTIKILNDKGYMTKFCCSGHYTGQHPRAYITFYEGIDIPSVPNGFKKEMFNNCVCLETILPLRKPTIGDFYKICDNAKTLLKWANKLPYYEEAWSNRR